MSKENLFQHLRGQVSNVCMCWSITRVDGTTFGFTDHDLPLAFEGITFQADSGLSADALARTTGLSVDNTEAIGLLQSDVISETDIKAGRYDGAMVKGWLVQWDKPQNRVVRFAGSIGEITRRDGQFQAELRGIGEALNQPQGRSYLRTCSAVLGDQACGLDLNDPTFRIETDAVTIIEDRTFRVAASAFQDRWFEQGKLTVLSGNAIGLTGAIKHDVRHPGGDRDITLWHPLRAEVAVGDTLRLDAGCDKRAATCKEKFSNFINFQGFPDMPGDDWMMSVPRSSDDSDGGSLVR